MRVYYRKLRETEAELAGKDIVVVSLATPDGGAEGIKSEVQKPVAARLIVDGKARLATAEEAAEYHEQMREARRLAEQAAAASRMQVTVISDADLRLLRKKA
jgi:hypothetical protein